MSVTLRGEVPCQYRVRGDGRMRWGPCPPCVPEVRSKVLPSSVKYFVSTEVGSKKVEYLVSTVKGVVGSWGVGWGVFLCARGG